MVAIEWLPALGQVVWQGEIVLAGLHHKNKQQQNQATNYPVLRAIANTSRPTQSRLTCFTADMYNTRNEKINDLELNVCC